MPFLGAALPGRLSCLGRCSLDPAGWRRSGRIPCGHGRHRFGRRRSHADGLCSAPALALVICSTSPARWVEPPPVLHASPSWPKTDPATPNLHTFPKSWKSVLAPHLYPQPRIAQGLWLQRRGLASAALDVSDGLSTDLAHLCKESGVAAEVDAALRAHPPGRNPRPGAPRRRGLRTAFHRSRRDPCASLHCWSQNHQHWPHRKTPRRPACHHAASRRKALSRSIRTAGSIFPALRWVCITFCKPAHHRLSSRLI